MFCGAISANAHIRLPEIFSDKMMLQAGSTVNIWGWSEPGVQLKLRTSWSPKTISAQADANGYWVVSIPTGEPGFDSQTISIKECARKGSEVTLSDILIGEVWFASGQSNMEMTLNSYGGCPCQNAREEVANAGKYVGIRICKVPKTNAATVQSEVSSTWMESNSDNAGLFSATAFFFAKHLQQVLNVPIGIIDCSRGSSAVESWMPHSKLLEYPDVGIEALINNPNIWNDSAAEISYNAMLYPVSGFTVRGFIWYQGETNAWRPNTYAERLGEMVSIWKKDWADRNPSNAQGVDQMPFYIVEIAPWAVFSPDKDGRGILSALLREQQRKASLTIPNSGFVTTNDLVYPYEKHQGHPSQKEAVGERLSYLALNRTYGYKGIICDYPEFSSMEVKSTSSLGSLGYKDERGTLIAPPKDVKNCVEIHFTNTMYGPPWYNGGLSPMYGIKGFELAGEDRLFHEATAIVNDRVLVVWSEEVPEPVAVRYGFRDFLPGNLKNGLGMPVIPFRSDSW